MIPLGDGIWVRHLPFRLLGAEMGKTVTVMQLPGDELVIHSGAPLSPDDVAAIRRLGRVRWLLEGARTHDTFARELRAMFPEATYLLPPRFPIAPADLAPRASLRPAPPEWTGEIEVRPIDGIPIMNEHALYHRRSRTLVLTDLVFNLAVAPGGRIPFFLRWVSGIRAFPATSRLVRASVRDRAAVGRSVAALFDWDFVRVVVGHGEVIADDARETLRRALDWARR